jgi:ATP-dependent Clp protease ATP-binding subunit ClpX
MTEENPPRPEEIQRELEEMMRERFGNKVQVVTKSFPMGAAPSLGADAPEQEEEEKKEFKLDFNYRPKDIKTYLDKYVIKQDEAKKALAIAVCDHYNHIRQCHEKTQRGEELNDDQYQKQNVLILGPTGVGKTYLVRMIAKLIGVPFVKADATRFSETGYVGANVDDMVRDLVQMADGNIELAQYGIIYFDEADKIAGSSTMSGKDISGRGVQYGLLKLMEETEIDLTSSHDMISQIQTFIEFQRKGKLSKKVVNTKNILFIVSGAFSNLEEIIKRRLRTNTIGLKSLEQEKLDPEDIFAQVSTKDLIDFGLEPEFVGRLPVRISCQTLSAEDLYHILKNSKGSIIRQYEQSFLAYGLDILFTDEALRRIAEIAHEEKTGARALMTVCELILRDYKFELPSSAVKGLTVTKELVDHPAETLEQVLRNPGDSDFQFFRQHLEKVMQELSEHFEIDIQLEISAILYLYQKAQPQNQKAREIGDKLFHEFVHGLKIIMNRKGISKFLLDDSAVSNPTLFLDKMLSESYH